MVLRLLFGVDEVDCDRVAAVDGDAVGCEIVVHRESGPAIIETQHDREDPELPRNRRLRRRAREFRRGVSDAATGDRRDNDCNRDQPPYGPATFPRLCDHGTPGTRYYLNSKYFSPNRMTHEAELRRITFGGGAAP